MMETSDFIITLHLAAYNWNHGLFSLRTLKETQSFG